MSVPLQRRPPAKRRHIVVTLRRAILDGSYKPGERLPTRQELSTQFATGPLTIQAAMNELVEDGFVVARDQRGTFVTDAPPHLRQYGLVFPTEPNAAGWACYWTALSHEAHRLAENAGDGSRFRIYHSVNSPDAPGYHALLADAQAGRLAGLVFPSRPVTIAGTPLMRQKDLPRVAVMDEDMPGTIHLRLDNFRFVDQALQALANAGCQRPAVLCLPSVPADWLKYLANSIVSHGMTYHEPYLQFASFHHPAAVARLCRLLFHADLRQRPDGLLVCDDNLLEHATDGLVQAGVTAADELPIVSHCNFPWPTASHLPTRRLGFDICQVLGTAKRLIDEQRLGQRARSAIMECQWADAQGNLPPTRAAPPRPTRLATA